MVNQSEDGRLSAVVVPGGLGEMVERLTSTTSSQELSVFRVSSSRFAILFPSTQNSVHTTLARKRNPPREHLGGKQIFILTNLLLFCYSFLYFFYLYILLFFSVILYFLLK